MNSWNYARRYRNPPAPRRANDAERINRVLALINSYGGIEGDHHKAWVLDQAVRILCATDERYQEWVEKHQRGEDGPETYFWETGVAP